VTTTGIGAAGIGGLADVTEAADELIKGLMERPMGRVSASVYETGRLVTLSPWLGGHVERLRFLLASQRTDGSWVSPLPAYALIPTLSATEALLATLRKPEQAHPGVSRTELAKAAREGVAILSRWLDGTRPLELPDMPAVEHIAPVLIKMIDRHLRHEGVRLQPPPGLDGVTAEKVRALLARGVQVPQKLLHALEIGQEAARGAPSVRPEPTGSIGASPAATAAWIGDQSPDDPDGLAPRFLETVARQHGGPVPSVIPITNFERAWVLSWLIGGGVPVTVPPDLVSELRSALGSRGTSGGSGLPADADTTSGVLYALSLLGAPQSPDLLWAYETETHFCTWQGENGRSVTTNAHVLEAFGHYLESTGGRESAGRYQATITKVASWLCAQQGDDGGWRDRWHASPYYATVCCALALHRFGGAASSPAVDRAVRWVVGTQHPDGSWGRWGGTAEETAYALQVLVLTGGEASKVARAVTRGRGYLRSVAESAMETNNPPLWHDKDLYCPIAVVRAAILAALHLTRRNTLT
jgi:halimadienyl-diphosphate synthase